MQALLNHIQKFVSLSEEEQEILQSYIVCQEVNKKDYLLRQGQVCMANYFILKGCFRLYYMNDNGIEQILHFGIDNWWISDYDSLEKETPSEFFLQAVEHARIAVLKKSVQEELFTKIPKMERYFRLVFQKAYTASQQRIKYIYTFSGEERYHHFNKSFPGFVQRIPQYMLASYLGFTPEFLSKVRAKKEK
ncbi:cAMP-binding domain of CRP or a regulatory subunit of cAMP-dependent protein kinases [Chitinophaga sp. CF118]|uniref:Crp/Fnr family transcriptional regulator n=1 Tax=Chitinophaga sp. CF118 TaxID=1884367 RepID=UPI0008EEA517|nr:Crp/Fnr family transcriptional regulator [Chitinophaga sp. CF118]SFE06961.1 cAMP-binding domain of CRP or a regulatory subunit of cAMP-dependent protein kinases [Chitinophaga sp. CF118]